jgi:DNA modification methylase
MSHRVSTDTRSVLDKYHIADARQLSDLLPDDQFIDVTVTSPPYWNLKDYGVRQQIGFGQTYRDYLADLQQVFTAIHKRTKPTGSLWIISDTFKEDGNLVLLPFDIANSMRDIGWILQDVIIWQKDRTLPWSHQGKLRNIFEYVALYSKCRTFKYHLSRVRDSTDVKNYWVRYPERYSPQGKTPSRHWVFPIPRQGSWGKSNNHVKHACPLPTPLVERILSLSSDEGDVILDPFAGSGSVLATAHAMRRSYIGLDLNEKYKSMFVSRVLPAVISQYASRESDAHGKMSSQRRFAAAITDLRMLKYPKELLRLYRRHNGALMCCAILLIRENESSTPSVIFVFPKGTRVPATFLKNIRKLCAKAPLSKYGIQPEFCVCTKDRMLSSLTQRGLRKSSRLHVYRNGHFYSWKQATTVSSIPRLLEATQPCNGDGRAYPPILSNISVRIDPACPSIELEVDHDSE